MTLQLSDQAIENMAAQFLPRRDLPIERQRELTLLAMCVWGEARGESAEGKLAVAWVVCNRAENDLRWDGDNVREVILAPWQFSVFNPRDPDRVRLITGPLNDLALWTKCFRAAWGAYSRSEPDPTGGADHYLARWLWESPARPVWAGRKSIAAEIGGHVFLT